MIRDGRCASVVFLWAVFAGRPATVRAQDSFGEWIVEYHTKAVIVVKVEDSTKSTPSPVPVFTAQNISGRPITALTVAEGLSTRLTFSDERSFEPAWRPGATVTLDLSIPKAPRDWVMHVKAVLFGDGEAASDGDPKDIEWMRFHRLGVSLEGVSCEAKVRVLDPARFDEASLNAAIGSFWSLQDPFWQGPSTLETVLGSIPDLPLKRKLPGASDRAKDAFVRGAQESSDICRRCLQQFLQEPESSRARVLSGWEIQPNADLLQRAVEVDFGVAK
jgi:hypothetical protein